MASWHGQEMSVELDELCEWCFEGGRERPATSMLAGVPLCESCSTGKQTRFTEKKVELYATEPAATSPARSIPVPKKVDVPQVEKIVVHEAEPEAKPAPTLVKKEVSIWDNHYPCACGCKGPIANSSRWGKYIPGHEPAAPKPVNKWEQCFKEIAGIKVGEHLTVKMPDGGNRNQMNSALGMNALTSKWRWSLKAHHDKTVTVKKIGDLATKDSERLADDEMPERKRKPEPPPKPKEPMHTIKRSLTILLPQTVPVMQVQLTPALADAVWDSLTIVQKATLWDVDSLWRDMDDDMRMSIVSKVLLIDPDAQGF